MVVRVMEDLEVTVVVKEMEPVWVWEVMERFLLPEVEKERSVFIQARN